MPQRSPVCRVVKCQLSQRMSRLPQRDPAHILARSFSSILLPMEGSNMCLIYGLIILAMLFFVVLPITDARTARMKLSVVSSLGALLAVSVVVPRLMH
jgi:di/tricarboxylate transporter